MGRLPVRPSVTLERQRFGRCAREATCRGRDGSQSVRSIPKSALNGARGPCHFRFCTPQRVVCACSQLGLPSRGGAPKEDETTTPTMFSPLAVGVRAVVKAALTTLNNNLNNLNIHR